MKKKILWGFASLAILIIIFLLLLHAPFVRAKVLKKVQEHLVQNYNLSLSASSLDYNLAALRVTLKDPALRAADKPLDPPFFQAGELTLRLTPALLLGKSLDIREIRVIDPGVDISEIPPQLLESPGDSPAPPLTIRRIDIRNGRIRYRDPSTGLEADIPGISLTGALGEKQNQILELRVNIDMNAMETGKVVYGSNGIKLQNAAVTVSPGDNHARFSLKGTELSTNETVDIDGRVQWEENHIAFPLLHIAAAEGDISGNADIYPNGGKIPNRLSLRWKSIDLQSRLVTTVFPHPVDSWISGDLDLALPEPGPRGIREIRGNATLDFGALPLKKTPPPGERFPLTGRVSLRLEPGKISVPGFNLSTLADNTPALVRGNLYLDFAGEKTGSFGGELHAAYKRFPPMEGRLRFSGRALDTTGTPSLRVRIENGEFQRDGRPVLEPMGDFLFRNNTLETRNLTLRFMGGEVEISGTLPMGSGGPPGNTMDIVVRAKNIGIERMGRDLGWDVPVKGTLSVNARVRPGRVGAELEVAGPAYGTSGGIDPGDLRVGVEIAGDRVDYHIRTTAPELPLDIRGDARLTAPYPFHGTARINVPDLDKLSKRRGFDILDGISGHIDGSVNFRGELGNTAQTTHADVTVDSFLMRTGERELVNSSPLRFSYGPGGLKIDTFDLKGPASSIHVSGQLPLDGAAASTREGTEATDGLTLRAAIDTRLLNPFVNPLSVDGTMDLHARVSGSLARPVSAAELVLKDIAVSGPNPLHSGPPDDPDARFRARLEGSVNAGGPMTALTGAGGFIAGARFTVLQFQLPGLPAFRIPPEQPVNLRFEGGRLLAEPFTITDENGWNRLVVSGSVPLTGPHPQPMDIRVNGTWDARLAGLFLEDMELQGKNTADIRVTGGASGTTAPVVSGVLEIRDNDIRYPDMDMFFHQVNGRVRFTPGPPGRLQLESVTGYLNGGDLSVEGGAVFKGGDFREFPETDIKLTAQRSRFEFPPGLASEVSGSLALTAGPGAPRLKGTVEIAGAVYQEPFNVMSQLFGYLRNGDAITVTEEESPFMDSLQLDIRLLTTSPALVSNNISRSELTADLTLRGTLSNPTLAGRLNLKEGGEIYLGNNTYTVESGTIHFVNPYLIEPDLAIRARTKVEQYDIRLDINGTPETLSAALSSTPALSEPNIISLLATGRTLDNASASLLDTTGSQALLYIQNAVSGKLQQAIKNTLGIETVRFDGSLIALKEDPGARLTVGQSLTSNFKLTLSQNLKQSQNRTWIVDYTPLDSLKLQGIKRDKEQYTAGVRYETRFDFRRRPGRIGEGPDRKSKKPRIVGRIEIKGDTRLSAQRLRNILQLREGRPFDFYKFHRDLDRLRTLYRQKSYLRAEILPARIEENGKITIRYTVTPGPRIALDFQGDPLPRRLREKAVKLWMDGRFDRQSIKKVVTAIRDYFFKKGFYRAEVIPGTPGETNGITNYPFTIKKGIKYREASIRFNGNRSISSKRLVHFLKSNRLGSMIFELPAKVGRELTLYYREQGFLGAHVGEPEIRFFPQLRNVVVTFPVLEGPRFRIRNITFQGNRFLDTGALIKASGIRRGGAFSPAGVKGAAYELTAAYGRKGYTRARIVPETRVLAEESGVDILFRVEENRRGVIGEIAVIGNTLTRDAVIRRELTFKKGETVDFREINKSRRKLYDLGIFERVNIEVAAPEDLEGTGETDLPYRVEVQVTEIKPFRFSTGLQWDTESGFGTAVELDNANVLGTAHYMGAGFTMDRRETSTRVYYRFPYFFGKKIATESFVFANRKEEDAYTIERRGLTLQQQYRPSKSLFFSWNYTLEQTWTDDVPLRLGHINAAFTWDRRDSLINPTRGHFLSLGLMHAARYLGSDTSFSRYFGEFHFYRPLNSFLVSATSLRIGAGHGLGRENLPAERFYAGGGTTIRGFKRNGVGPLDADNNPLGGEALFIFKQELRARVHPLFSVVVFADIGNVYDTTPQFDIFDVRKSAGFGLRLHTDPFLLRFDWGFNLQRREGEPASRVFFSIGQSF